MHVYLECVPGKKKETWGARRARALCLTFFVFGIVFLGGVATISSSCREFAPHGLLNVLFVRTFCRSVRIRRDVRRSASAGVS